MNFLKVRFALKYKSGYILVSIIIVIDSGIGQTPQYEENLGGKQDTHIEISLRNYLLQLALTRRGLGC